MFTPNLNISVATGSSFSSDVVKGLNTPLINLCVSVPDIFNLLPLKSYLSSTSPTPVLFLTSSRIVLVSL